MGNTLTSYTDDAATRDALAKAGSKLTLHEIYGLFYGSLAAPDPADPAEHVPVLFKDAAVAPSEKDAENVRRNLQTLWNFIERWKPETEPFYFPEQDYTRTYQCVLQHLTDDLALVQFFIAGLNLGFRNGSRGLLEGRDRRDARTDRRVGASGEKHRSVRGPGPECCG